MISEAYAIKVQTRSGIRFFCGFGKNKSIRTAWTLAGAELFLSPESALAVLRHIKMKKECVVVMVAALDVELDFDECPF